MLVSLSIKNYALIQEANLEFSEGFTVITGETGAGKSILLGALGLITGKRADSTSAGDKSKKCIIEGEFAVEAYQLQPFFQANDLDYESNTIIRREILPSGKSRAFVNDTPVNLMQLQALGAHLVDIHSQYKTLDIITQSYQYDVLDTFANSLTLRSSFITQFELCKNKKEELQQLLDKKNKAQLEHDYQSFLYKELDEAQLKEGEFEVLEDQLKTLSNSEEIKALLSSAAQRLNLDDLGIVDTLQEVKNELQKLASYSNQYKEMYDRIQSTYIELDDIAQEIAEQSSQVNTDPKELEQINNRVQLLYNLKQKHQVQDVAGLIAIRDELDASLYDLQNVDGAIAVLENDIAQAIQKATLLAKQLHEKRLKAIPSLKASIENILQAVGMPNAIIHFDLRKDETLNPRGNDKLNILFSANSGLAPVPLQKGASGGELSRVMLAIKAVVSRHKKLPTLIFDEIDTGVSGEVALKMGEILKSMGKIMQLMTITHLPQIAGQGSQHLKVFKTSDAHKTVTQICELNYEDRIIEIAQMLGGASESKTALEHAKILLN